MATSSRDRWRRWPLEARAQQARSLPLSGLSPALFSRGRGGKRGSGGGDDSSASMDNDDDDDDDDDLDKGQGALNPQSYSSAPGTSGRGRGKRVHEMLSSTQEQSTRP